ncbi:hypothetical protein PtB15_12B569 [Puccinia triticina]|nr:hypothetical protein PtB15_12B569 [Puccinia triticina]
MINAGLTGSPIHVYRFSYCPPASTTSRPSSASILPKLENKLFFKTQPGLSSYAGRLIDAAESLRPLLQAALNGVPLEQRSCTPISVKATAGLGLLGDSQSKEILDEVSRWLRASWPFKLSPSAAGTSESELLSKLPYDLSSHPPETTDWLNVLLAQAIIAYQSLVRGLDNDPTMPKGNKAKEMVEEAMNFARGETSGISSVVGDFF